MKKRILGIDFGLKRIGIALTDENNIIASGLTTIPSVEILDFLQKTVTEKNIGTIVVGEPKRLNMEDTHSTKNVYLFKESLQKLFPEIDIILVDERFTSKIAMDSLIQGGVSKKKRRQKGIIDEVSATIILQSYMQQQGM